MNFVKIPTGKFFIGSPENEPGRWTDETQHEVTIEHPFEMMTTQVTQRMWIQSMGTNPSRFKGDFRPVEGVSWNDCCEFIKIMNRGNDGYVYSLPTEAEWEYACRAGTTGTYSFKDDKIEEYAWFNKNSTQEVGLLKPNPWGLRDMHGNVWEWCQDWYGPYPKAPDTGSYRVLRGGGWYGDPRYLRSAQRNNGGPGGRSAGVGFRLVRIRIPGLSYPCSLGEEPARQPGSLITKERFDKECALMWERLN